MTHEFLPLTPPRSLTPEEDRLLRQLLFWDFPGRDQLLNQMQSARVVEECKECRSIVILVDKLPENIADVKRRVPVHARAVDLDGGIMHILLHVVHGFIDEMEIYREDLSDRVKELPEPGSLEFIDVDDGH
jgi:hypothetical protein